MKLANQVLDSLVEKDNKLNEAKPIGIYRVFFSKDDGLEILAGGKTRVLMDKEEVKQLKKIMR